MDLSPTDLQLVSFDLYKTDEKYDFKLTDILRRRHRPVLLILDKFGDLVYSCRPDETPPTDRFTPVITTDLLKLALREARHLMRAEEDDSRSVVRQVIINKPDEKCALIVLEKQFWCVRIFELDGGVIEVDKRYAALIEPIGNPQAGNLDLDKVKGLFRLSKREADVVEELVSGSTDKEIALQLGISVETVRAYLKSVRAKLGVSTRTAIVSVVHNLRDQNLPSA
ncbi:MAG: helix-turn-helix transcriptional regulator [Gammaproteobacteria bacterium]|nr:helix-turn-helix transcriptional regulator [Gammaproteobacteria bacterium]